jgi:MacB-like periplasmic core domain
MGPKPPFPVAFSQWAVTLASHMVPRAERGEWRREWNAELWHNWRFLLDAGLWSHREAVRLFARCLGSFADAAWHFGRQDAVQDRIRECTRSPWTCLALLAPPLLLVTILSHGLPATRQMLKPVPWRDAGQLALLSVHDENSNRERGVRPDVMTAWLENSRLVDRVAPLNWHTAHDGFDGQKPLVVAAEPGLFLALGVEPNLGSVPQRTKGLVITDSAWRKLFGHDPYILGRKVEFERENLPIVGVLPSGFWFLSRGPTVFVIRPELFDLRVMVLLRARDGATSSRLVRELTRICQNTGWSMTTVSVDVWFLREGLWMPGLLFMLATAAALLLAVFVRRLRIGNLRKAMRVESRGATLRRGAFFFAKCLMGLLVVFCAALEWARRGPNVLLAYTDSASSPMMLWLYILSAMGVLFWAWANQRARCRVCLRLLAFPVRIGCPGCLLLDWSGTELLCEEGHGVLHVPHMVASWDEQPDRWLTLDDSWRDCFAHSEPG